MMGLGRRTLCPLLSLSPSSLSLSIDLSRFVASLSLSLSLLFSVLLRTPASLCDSSLAALLLAFVRSYLVPASLA